MAMLQYGENFRKIQQFLNLESQAWDRLILLHEARHQRLSASDEEVRDRIRNIYGFKTAGGGFDLRNYDYFVRSAFRMTPRNFEEAMRNTIKIQKLIEKETSSLSVSDAEALTSYQLKNEKVQVSYAIFPLEDFKKQIIFDETKAREFFEKKKDSFVLPPSVRVEFLTIPIPKSGPETQSPPSTSNPEEGETNPEAEAAWTKAQDIYEQILNGKDFQSVADANGLKVQTSEPLSMEQPPDSFSWPFNVVQKIFQAGQGDILEPVQTSDSFQILRIKEKRDAAIPEYAQVKERVREAWLDQEAQKLSQAKAEEAREALLAEFAKYRNPDFVQIAKTLNLNIAQTPLFSRGEYVQGIGVSQGFQEAAFALTKTGESISPAVGTQKGYCLLHLDSQSEPDQAEFEKNKEEIKKALFEEKRDETFLSFLSRLRLQANLEDNVAKIREAQGKKPYQD